MLAQVTFHNNTTIMDNHIKKLVADGIVMLGSKNVIRKEYHQRTWMF